MKVFHLKFNKEANGAWYIDFPNYPFSHHNLMMVAGADLLCEYVAQAEGHPGCAQVDVTLDSNLLDGRQPDIVMTRWRKGYGADYKNTTPDGFPPLLDRDGRVREITDAWLCPVTLLVLHKYPGKINLYMKN